MATHIRLVAIWRAVHSVRVDRLIGYLPSYQRGSAVVENLESRILLSNITPPFSPQNIIQAYGLNQTPGKGAGETIAIVAGFADPNIYQEIKHFDSEWSLTPLIPSSSGATSQGPTLTVENQYGESGPLPIDAPSTAYAKEIPMDVEWSHVVASQANILLIECDVYTYADIIDGVVLRPKMSQLETIESRPGKGRYEKAFQRRTDRGHSA